MMIFFNKPQLLELKKADIRKAYAFSEAVVSTVDYKDSNQLNIYKIQNDHFISKIGELAVCRLCRKFDKMVIGPDFNIYLPHQKSWDPDLMVDGTVLAVKTQKRTMSRKYGLSWTFQDSERRKDPILSKKNAWVCFVECNNTKSSYPCTIYPFFQINNLIFKPPKLDYLKGKKQVVYADDLMCNWV